MAFHMPAFIFISGYFSKRIPSLKKMLCGLVIPYFVYEILYYLLYTFVLDKETGFYFARPKFSLWYLMALFAWRLFSPLVEKIPGCMILSVIAGILIGFTDFGNFLSIPRILFFFPFFLAGKKFDSSSLARFRNRKGYLGALTILGGFAVFLFTDNYHHRLDQKIFYGRYSYADMDMGSVEGVLVRIGCYLISFLLIYLFMLVLPTEKKSYSYLGERTMAIYIFHGFVYSCLKYGSSILTSVESNLECLYLLAFCFFGMVFIEKTFCIVYKQDRPSFLMRGLVLISTLLRFNLFRQIVQIHPAIHLFFQLCFRSFFFPHDFCQLSGVGGILDHIIVQFFDFFL